MAEVIQRLDVMLPQVTSFVQSRKRNFVCIWGR
jgi:hypothetical protein